MSRFRVMCRHLDDLTFNSLITHIPVHALRKWWLTKSGAQIGKRAYLMRGCEVHWPHQLTIGDHVSIGFRCLLDARGWLVIGQNVVIASDVQFLPGGHDITDPDFSVHDPGRELSTTWVEDYVWIASRATVVGPGVRIGRGSVVSACACVASNVAPLAVVSGVPARPVATRPESALRYTVSFHLPMS